MVPNVAKQEHLNLIARVDRRNQIPTRAQIPAAKILVLPSEDLAAKASLPDSDSRCLSGCPPVSTFPVGKRTSQDHRLSVPVHLLPAPMLDFRHQVDHHLGPFLQRAQGRIRNRLIRRVVDSHESCFNCWMLIEMVNCRSMNSSGWPKFWSMHPDHLMTPAALKPTTDPVPALDILLSCYDQAALVPIDHP